MNPPFYIESGDVDVIAAEARRFFADYAREDSATYAALANIPMGVGKTREAVRLAIHLALRNKRVLYLVHRHAQYDELMAMVGIIAAEEKIDADDPALDWLHWYPRQLVNEDRNDPATTCHYAPLVNAWQADGYVAKPLCRHLCGERYMRDECIYYAQARKKSRVVVGQHQHLRGISDLKNFDFIIVDELPLRVLCNEIEIKPNHLTGRGLFDDNTHPFRLMLASLSHIAENAEEGVYISGPLLMEKLGGAEDVLEACVEFDKMQHATAIQVAERMAKEVLMFKSWDEQNIPPYHYPELSKHLRQMAEWQINVGEEYRHSIFVSRKGIEIYDSRFINGTIINEKKVLFLDGTADPRLYQSMLGDRPLRVYAPSVPQLGNVIQITDHFNGKRKVCEAAEKDEAGGTARMRELSTIMTRIAEERGVGGRAHPTSYIPICEACYAARRDECAHLWSVITFKAFADYLNANHICPIPADNFSCVGSNAYRHAKLLFIVGVAQPDTTALIRQATMVFPTELAAYGQENYNAETMFKRHPDGRLEQRYPDERLHLLWKTLVINSVEQAVHRARINRRNDCDVILLTSLHMAESGLSDVTVKTTRDLIAAPAGVAPDVWLQALSLCREATVSNGEGLTVRQLMSDLSVSKSHAQHILRAMCEYPDFERHGRCHVRWMKA